MSIEPENENDKAGLRALSLEVAEEMRALENKGLSDKDRLMQAVQNVANRRPQLRGFDMSTENCYLQYDDAPGYLVCSYSHKLGEECLMDDRS